MLFHGVHCYIYMFTEYTEHPVVLPGGGGGGYAGDAVPLSILKVSLIFNMIQKVGKI